MDDLGQITLGYVRQILRRQKIVAAMGVTLCCLGWGVVSMLPNVYEGTASIYIDARSFLDELLQGMAVDERGESEEILLLARNSLTNRQTIEKVIRETDLSLTVRSDGDLEDLVLSIESRIDVQTAGGRTPNQLIVTYRDSDPEIAQKTIQVLLNTMIETSLGTTRTDTEQSEIFLENQISEYESRLLASEAELSSFKRANIGLLPGEGQSYFGQLQEVRNEYQDIKLQHEEAMLRRDRLKDQVEQIRLPGNKRLQSASNERVRALRAQLDDLLLRYTENHPEVVSTLEQISRLLETGELEEPQSVNDSNSIGTDIIAAEFMVQLSNAEAEVSSVAARLREYQRRLTNLEEAITTMPEIEAQLAKLTRDYDINRSQYEQLVERRESARLSREAGLNGDSKQFRIIEPPHTGSQPVSPNRLILNSAAFVVSWGIAFGFAILLAEIRPTIATQDQLFKLADWPVIGTITMQSDFSLRNEGIWTLVVGVALSLVVYLLIAGASLGLLPVPTL